MSWKDCIQSAVESGRIGEAKAQEALDAFDAEHGKALAEGMTEIAAETRAADAAVEAITTLKKAKRWERVNTLQRTHELHTRLMNSDEPWEELEKIINDLEYADNTVRSILMAGLDEHLLRYKPKYGGFVVPTDKLNDIVRAAYGDVRSPEAKEMFEALAAMDERARQWANMHGASIAENPNRRLSQTHDSVKVSAVTKDKWVNQHMEWLDWEVMRFEGKAIAPENRQEVLERTYDGIRSDGFSRGQEAQGNQPNLAGRLARDKFLYYKDADSYIEAMDQYGAGNLFEQTIGKVDALAKDISLLRVFGPTADASREFAVRAALKRASDLDGAAGANQRKFHNKTKRQVEVFEDEYKIHAMRVPSLDGNLAMSVVSTIRTVAVQGLLGGVLIPSMGGDVANAKMARKMFNLPSAGVIRNYWANWIPTKQNRREAIRAGVIFENGISLAHARQRYFGALDGPTWARRFSDITYRVGLAAHHTQVIRNSEGKQFMGVLADRVDKQFDELEFAPMLAEVGITARDWDIMRKIPIHDANRAHLLRPVDAFEKHPEVAEKFSDLLQMYVRTAVPDTTLRQRRAVGEAIDPNSFMGQFVRSTTSLVSFPVSLYFNQLRRIANAPTVRDKVQLGAMYFAWMTVGGMFITQAKALAKGQELYNMNPLDLFDDDKRASVLDFYGRSVVNGGSLGILGDLVFNNINISNSGYRPGNPTEEYLKSAHKLTVDNLIDAAQGKELNLGADAARFIDKNMPNFWQFGLIWDRALGDELLRQSDPKAYAAKRRYEREHEEGMWWGMGEDPDTPDLETAAGEF